MQEKHGFTLWTIPFKDFKTLIEVEKYIFFKNQYYVKFKVSGPTYQLIEIMLLGFAYFVCTWISLI